MSLADGGRLDCGPGMPCGHHGEAVNRFCALIIPLRSAAMRLTRLFLLTTGLLLSLVTALLLRSVWADWRHVDAAELGLADGARVTVETSHGSVEALAWIYPGIRRHAVFVPIGWGERQPFNPWRPVNFLTDKSQRDPISEQTNLKSLLCRVTPV